MRVEETSGYSEYSRLTWGTPSTHMGYSEFSHGALSHRIQEVRVEETSGYNPNFFTSLDAEKYQVGGNRQALQPPTLKAAIVNRRISLPTVSRDE